MEETAALKKQQKPNGSGVEIIELVKQDLIDRAEVGEKKYGQKLKPFNGRSALVDAYQEALDLSMYLRQKIYEEDSGGKEAIVSWMERQISWSQITFGSGNRTLGIVKHIKKELIEIEQDPFDLLEWIDVIILALDGYWRHGGNPETLLPDLNTKQTLNFSREYPFPVSEDEPSEHLRASEIQPKNDSNLLELHLKIIRDDAINGFAAYCANDENPDKSILLNIYATFAASVENNIDVKEILIQNLMHEFGHALEEYFDKEFDEDFIDKTVDTYFEKYGEEAKPDGSD